ncbi:MAG: hypothetical protein LQ351_002234 [Letrouitia transgressa]|nr:MAG: hypothetical protein LQ351_002234 [Letrouitia transgressa]
MTMIVIACQLVTNQDKRLQLFHELETAMPDLLGVPPLQDLEQLPYLTAVILEGLRMSNVSSHRLLRAYPDTTLSYGDFEIPAGTPISMTPLHIHENPEIFPEPFEFKPERWLINNQQRLRRYLVPFGKGKRACLGKNLAWAQLYLFTAMVFRRFDFELHNVVKQRDFVVSRDTVVGSASTESHGVTACVTDPQAK